jgi:hypothetical protein
VSQEGRVVTLRVEYAGSQDSPPTSGPTYVYRIAPGELVEDTTHENAHDDAPRFA